MRFGRPFTPIGVQLTVSALAALLLSFPPTNAGAQTSTTRDDAWCDGGRDGDRARHCEVRELQVPRPAGRLSVDAAPNGGIEVEAWEEPTVRVRARVVAMADVEADARLLAERVQILTDGDRVRASGPMSDGDGGWWVSYRISVPRDLDLELRSKNGGLVVRGVTSRVDLRTTNGSIRLADTGGDVRGRTTNGSVHVDLSGDGWTGDGLDLETTNGGIRLTIPETYAAHLETGTVNGGWDIDYPLTVTGRIGRRLEADLGAGGPPIRAITTNGGIRIDRR